MRTVTESFACPCTVEVFWGAFMDAGYLRGLYLDALGFSGFEILELGPTSRRLRIVPKLNLPDVLARLIGERFAYEEHGVLDRGRNEWTWRMVVPDGAIDVVSTHGTVRVMADGEAACRRHDELSIAAKVFGLGRIIESAAEKEARSAWAKEPSFFARWVQGQSTRIAPPTSTAPPSAR
jgi:hypothetical protein